MKAIYESGIPISFKGSMVLKACLMEAGFTDDTRHTVDIDANWYSDEWPSGVHMEESIQKALQNSGRTLGSFDGFLNKPDELKHAYNKFRFDGDVYKPAFENVYQTVREYIAEVLPENRRLCR